jgi:hypothetical protein
MGMLRVQGRTRVLSAAVALLAGIGLLVTLASKRGIPSNRHAAFETLIAQMDANPKQPKFVINYRCFLVATCSITYDRSGYVEEDQRFRLKSTFDLQPDVLRREVKAGRY